MTHQPADLLLATHTATAHTVELVVSGDLDYYTSDEFRDAASAALDAHHNQHGPVLRHLHLNCRALGAIDSSGLSALLALHRRTHPAGVTLHLDHQPCFLVRMLEITGTGEYLTAPAHQSGDLVAPAEPTSHDENQSAAAPVQQH
ncbi:STAS domain-containing protein [Streptomyces collinus]